jgi:hypothetical protein
LENSLKHKIMKSILFCLFTIISLKGVPQANYQFYKATIGAGLYFKNIPASALTLDSAVYVNRTTGEFQVRKVQAPGVTDTANKWLNDIRRRPGTDTVEKFKNGSWQFAYRDSTGSGGITSINSETGSSQTIAAGSGISVNSSSNTHTIGLNTTLDVQYADANNSGTSETDLYTKTIAANQLSTNGNTINFEIRGDFVNDPTNTVNLTMYFAGISFATTGDITLSGSNWSIRGTIVRTGTNAARMFATIIIPGASTKTYEGSSFSSGGMDYTITNILKVTGTAGGASGGSNDITARFWKVTFQP